MKLAVMQPYFFPYIGYFQLIQSTDFFVFFDTPQYERRGWMNRNRIINISEGSTYIAVPTVKAPQNTSLCDIQIDQSQDWKRRIAGQMDVYKKRAPYYNEIMKLLLSAFETSGNKLVDLNIQSIKSVCEYLELPFKYKVFSAMSLDIPENCAPDEWALQITKAMQYQTYINAPGGISFFNRAKYQAENIDLKFIQPKLKSYIQRIGRFESGLSILDVMMFNSKKTIQEMLCDYELV